MYCLKAHGRHIDGAAMSDHLLGNGGHKVVSEEIPGGSDGGKVARHPLVGLLAEDGGHCVFVGG